jgi:hypothetical protein
LVRLRDDIVFAWWYWAEAVHILHMCMIYVPEFLLVSMMIFCMLGFLLIKKKNGFLHACMVSQHMLLVVMGSEIFICIHNRYLWLKVSCVETSMINNGPWVLWFLRLFHAVYVFTCSNEINMFSFAGLLDGDFTTPMLLFISVSGVVWLIKMLACIIENNMTAGNQHA